MVDTETWILAGATLAGSVIGAWLVIRAAGREFHDAVIREVAEVQTKLTHLDRRFNDLHSAAIRSWEEVSQLQQVTAELKGIITMLRKTSSQDD